MELQRKNISILSITGVSIYTIIKKDTYLEYCKITLSSRTYHDRSNFSDQNHVHRHEKYPSWYN